MSHHFWLIMIITAVGPILGATFSIIRQPSEKYTYGMLAFSAGVMLMVSFYELLPQSLGYISVPLVAASMMLGALLILMVSLLIRQIRLETPWYLFKKRKLEGLSVFLIVEIFFHNIPEGIAIGLGSFSNLSLAIAMSIASHDAVEAVLTTVPYYHLTNNRLKSWLITMLTLIPTWFGFILTYYYFQDLSLRSVGMTAALIAGIMIYISMFKLIPSSIIAAPKKLWPSLCLAAGAVLVVIFAKI